MAEIRKHNPKVTGDIDRALLAALGETIRPVVPGTPKPDRLSTATDIADAPAPTSPAASVATFSLFNPGKTIDITGLRPTPVAEIDEEDSQPEDDDMMDIDDDYR